MVRADKTNRKNHKCRHCTQWDKESGYCDASGKVKKEHQTCRWFEWKDEEVKQSGRT